MTEHRFYMRDYCPPCPRCQQLSDLLRELVRDLDPWTDENDPWWPMFQLAESAVSAIDAARVAGDPE